MPNLIISEDGWLLARGLRLPCALGWGGRRKAKREGDGATPVGRFPLQGVLYRADRMAAPATQLPCRMLTPDDGWCDDPADALHYNRWVRLPHGSRTERLYRADSVYDVIVLLGYNDAPPVPGRGSAIFMHVARSHYAPTEGCIALTLADLLEVLRHAQAGDEIEIRPSACEL